MGTPGSDAFGRGRGLTPLRDLLARGAMTPRLALQIACDLCTVVGEIHRRKITHGAINPANILVDTAQHELQLLNIGVPPANPFDPAGRASALAYISPEQTGRMNRAVDYRTDFYSLGVTTFELLTGHPPFTSDDSLELIHAHIAKSPPSASELDPAIPEQLSRVLAKLLAKAAEDRYQSAHGLEHDLRRCLDEWSRDDMVSRFELGAQDVPDRFVVSRRLYGREREVAELLRAFEDTCNGRTALMLVGGYSGIGKTSLIQELYKPIVRERGYFIAGKFDQVVRDIPYGAFTQALRSLVWQLLTEREDRLATWRTRLSAALGGNGGVLAEMIPEIELILGKQPAPQPLDPTAAKNRFEYVFQCFVGALAQKDHPLVVFLDDLQWADMATLDLWHALLTSAEIRHLLLIGAYRDNEVDERHPLTSAVQRLEAAGGHVSRLPVGSLPLRDLASFLCDTLHREAEYVEPLARLIQQKTDGNPFFVIQFLTTLEQEGLLTFDRSHAGWSFDMEAIAAAGMTENVVDLMTRKIRRLSPQAQHLLTMAACIGNQFDWNTFLTIGRQAPDEASAALAEVLGAGLIQEARDLPGDPQDRRSGRTVYVFLHDRVQQAAYGLIPDAHRTPLHLDIGRLLFAEHDGEVPDERIFAIVSHMNIGSALIADPAERVRLARLNLSAGRKAKTSAAYRAALDYFERGIGLIRDRSWSADYELLFGLQVEAAESQYLTGAFDAAEDAFRTLLERAATALDRAQIHSLRITLYENQSRWGDAVSAGLEGLAQFAIRFPEGEEQKLAALDREVEAVHALVGERRIASLIDLPEMKDADIRMVLKILTILWAPAYIFGDEALARLISATIVRLSLEHGHTEDSAYGYVTHAITVGPIRKDYPAAYEWGTLALSVNRRFNDIKRRAKIHQQFQAHVNLWCRPFETCIPHAREATRSGLEAGDFPYAGYGAATEAWSAFLIARDLEQFVRDYTPTLAVLDKLKMMDFHGGHLALLNWARALQGRTADPLSLSDDRFDEQRFIDSHQGGSAFFLTFVYAAKLHLGLLFGRFTEALEAAAQARRAAATGTIWPVLIDFWSALAAASACEQSAADTRDGLRQRLADATESLAPLATACPENFLCMWLLLSAETSRLDGDVEGAVGQLREAIDYAQRTSNLQLEAIAHERCANIHIATGEHVDARNSLRDARRCYAQLGATAKVNQLDRRFGELVAVSADRSAVAAISRDVPPSSVAESVDMATVVKVAHAVAVEIEVPALLRTLMRLALENAGADRGVFVQDREGVLTLEAEATAQAGTVALGKATPIDAVDGLATSVVRYVHRTGRDVVIGDAHRDERCAADPYVLGSRVKSILCVPVAHQGRLRGILYLENTLTSDAFTPDRIEVMRILAAQTAISLENAQLYDDMRSEVERRTVAEQALRDALAEVQTLKNRLEAENVYLQEEIRTQHNFNEIVGNSPPLLEALHKVERVAPTDSTVLIVGETGCGKELFARAVHSRSTRRERPLVKVNCGAIAPGLVESELFGHVKGAFTGAIDKRVGRFELANSGTIFLDEVGELPPEAQVKLLRVLQEREFEPVGSSRTVRVNVRVIAATNRDLQQAVREGRFRADLLYRLNVFPIEVPPLRDRRSDIALLIGFFVSNLARKLGKPLDGFSTSTMHRLLTYPWPGNVRELQNVVERAAILAQGPILELEPAPFADAAAPAVASAHDAPDAGEPRSLQEIERLHIVGVLKTTGGVVEGDRGAARILGMHPNTLRSRMKKLGIQPPRNIVAS